VATTTVTVAQTYGAYTSYHYQYSGNGNGNPYYNNPYYNNPYYGGPSQVTQTTYVTQVQQTWQTQFLTQPITQYLTDTATVSSFMSQPVTDPLSVLGLIGAGVAIGLVAFAAIWILMKPRLR
jgi:hypothetical protein